MSNKIRILVVEPFKEPYIQEVNDNLEDLQNIVKGNIENLKLESNINLICNEYGKIKNLEFNRVIKDDVICGTFFIAAQEEKLTSLTKEQIQKYKKEFRLKNDEGIIELLRREVKYSSKLLKLNLKGIEQLKGRILKK